MTVVGRCCSDLHGNGGATGADATGSDDLYTAGECHVTERGFGLSVLLWPEGASIGCWRIGQPVRSALSTRSMMG